MKILLIVYDNGTSVHYFPLGTAYVAAALREAGHEVEIYSQDVNHWPESHLTEYLNDTYFDAVGLGFVGNYYTYRKAVKIAAAVRAAKARVHFFLGGHGPSADPGYFMQKLDADAVVVGEGEISVLDAVKRPGVFEGEQARDLDALPWPAYDLFPIEYYRLLPAPHSESSDFYMPVVSARGCLYKCNFCYRMVKGYRMRSIPDVIEEIKFLKRAYGITYIDFVDELTVSSVARATELSEAMMPLDLKWMCEGRLNVVTPDLLKLMRQSGCVFINYGIESMDNEVLKWMHKHLTVEQIHRGIEATMEAGISPGFNIIFGHIGDTPETLQKGVDFLLKYDDGAQRRTIVPVTPYPGCELYRDAVADGRLQGTGDFYENKHINSDLLTVNFTTMPDDEYYSVLKGANLALLNNYYAKKSQMTQMQVNDLYDNKNSTFRGFRA